MGKALDGVATIRPTTRSYEVSSIPVLLFLANLCHLLCELFIGCGYLAAFVVGKNAFSLCGGFHGTDEMGYLGIKHLNPLPICAFYRCGNLLRDICAWHYHRHKDAVNSQVRVDLPFDLRHGAKQQL